MKDKLTDIKLLKIIDIIDEAPDIKTFMVENKKNELKHQPGQICLLTPQFGQGEMAISISSSPWQKEFLSFTVKNVGRGSAAMHNLQVGDQLGVRGPYGRPFPMDELKGQNLVFIGGGIGLAPLRSVINTVMAQRDNFQHVYIMYGAKLPREIVFKYELFEVWGHNNNNTVAAIVDEADAKWKGEVGLVTNLLEKNNLPIKQTKVLMCGPGKMIKFVLLKLKHLGFSPDNILTTLEMKMKCGIGKCGRCNIGSKYVCQDGPVFKLSELEELPNEY